MCDLLREREREKDVKTCKRTFKYSQMLYTCVQGVTQFRADPLWQCERMYDIDKSEIKIQSKYTVKLKQ